MRVVHRTTSLIILSLWVASGAVAEWQPGPDDEILVSPEDPVTIIEWCDLMENDVLPAGCPTPGVSGVVVSPPSHGTLSSSEGGHLEYSPRKSFWRLGTDSFTYRLDFEITATGPEFVNVTLKAGHYGRMSRIDEPFESTSVAGLSGEAFVTPEAAIAGAMGLSVRVGSGMTDSVFTFYNDGEDPGDLCEWIVNCFFLGDGAQGGTDTMVLRPPPIEDPVPFGGGKSGYGQGQIGPVVIYSLEGFNAGEVAAEIELRPSEQYWEVIAHLYDFEGTYSTRAFLLTNPEPELRLDWWNSGPLLSGGSRDGGLMLWVDGEVVDSILGIQNWDVGIASRRIGAMIDPAEDVSLSLDIDNVRLRSSDESTPGAATILFDGFEDDLSDWDTSFAHAIDVDPAAALVGMQGLRIEPTMGVDSSVADTWLTAADQVGIRFKIAAGTLSMSQGDKARMLALSGESGNEQVRLLLQKQGNFLEIVPRVFSAGSWVALSGVPITPVTATIELRWRASDDGAENGRMSLWLDGRPIQDLQKLDNEGALIESVRLGAWSQGGATRGAFYVDNFESWSTVNAQ
ncbi:MAG: hypothetical protein GY719_30565 [bacterium]|nr:hypothetical protein [bacterium]